MLNNKVIVEKLTLILLLIYFQKSFNNEFRFHSIKLNFFNKVIKAIGFHQPLNIKRKYTIAFETVVLSFN